MSKVAEIARLRAALDEGANMNRIVLGFVVSCCASATSAQQQVACDPGWTLIHSYKIDNGIYTLADMCVDHMKDPRPVEIECSLDDHKWQSINGSCEAGLEARKGTKQ